MVQKANGPGDLVFVLWLNVKLCAREKSALLAPSPFHVSASLPSFECQTLQD